MKVSELSGVELDYWVAKAVGYENVKYADNKEWVTIFPDDTKNDYVPGYSPSHSWREVGPLIEKYGISLLREQSYIKAEKASARLDGLKYYYEALIGYYNSYEGPEWDFLGDGETPLTAACRCIVSSKYGDEVPDEG